MARPKLSNDIYISLSTRIKLDTSQRLDEYCRLTGTVKSSLIDQAINEYLEKLQLTN